ncbi:MAG TPA: hypothetical protein PK054_02350 [Anaerohalosphaeraceae bacterium]|nr:hypothetical protein [Anaerohalosphaeraceae bacterium]HOL87903.1 hypothetical protein [Anaerohalosphaeraceae bacterium]HPP55401.1 hypothetical protein [Anaerohalosphaeraceae bacterium]
MKNLCFQLWIFGILLPIGTVLAAAGTDCPSSADPNNASFRTVEKILSQMHQTAQTIQTLRADLTYLFVQDPELLDSKTLRRGTLFYTKGTGSSRSRLRLSFDTLQQDEEPPQPRPEHYLFDGVWLTKIDWALETIDRYQKAPADKPVGVFEFISHNFPMVGFTDPRDLENEFEITASPAPEDPNQPQHLALKVRNTSRYKEDYTQMEVWIDRKNWLPIRLTAVSVQGDFYDLKWNNLRINETIADTVFQIETPPNFRQNTHPLEQKSN